MQWLRINKYNVVHNGINESFTKGETTYSNCNKKKIESFTEGETTVINQSRNSRKMLIEDLPFDIWPSLYDLWLLIMMLIWRLKLRVSNPELNDRSSIYIDMPKTIYRKEKKTHTHTYIR